MANQSRTEVYKDGIMAYGDIITERVKGKVVGKVFKQVGTRYFALMEARSSDYALAEGENESIDLKIKTPYGIDFWKAKPAKVILEGQEYDVVSLDWDAEKTKLFWYLQKGGAENAIS
ncbi:phage head-tail adaptor [Listeria weihenstephanensis FSL R9-0317]|uniref:Phage head-tail adapter protein n=1 Tax=Listeria weihenstephanensis TaxID=1006155 RepID=A0A1S7FST8_9LIST|nr:hypothetical protein [Listeria weihenstephanensis]AQY50506.1 hypothetical protein UE46_05335 [Listeria phage LWP01] [Listeria weihenstephanensis]AQY52652.1 hypothetical protein UE46_p05335 [Listeria phage LWP01]EUJ41525.1 phage head-tail adaptor [Listeria weihenstephanensis FSL R9-0317]